jgi:hypothetical protein
MQRRADEQAVRESETQADRDCANRRHVSFAETTTNSKGKGAKTGKGAAPPEGKGAKNQKGVASPVAITPKKKWQPKATGTTQLEPIPEQQRDLEERNDTVPAVGGIDVSSTNIPKKTTAAPVSLATAVAIIEGATIAQTKKEPNTQKLAMAATEQATTATNNEPVASCNEPAPKVGGTSSKKEMMASEQESEETPMLDTLPPLRLEQYLQLVKRYMKCCNSHEDDKLALAEACLKDHDGEFAEAQKHLKSVIENGTKDGTTEGRIEEPCPEEVPSTGATEGHHAEGEANSCSEESAAKPS